MRWRLPAARKQQHDSLLSTSCEDNCLHQNASAAHGDESRWIDTGTVAGYRRVVMCQEARDEVEAALPPGADPAPLLLSMCARRLLPTPWLNKVLTPECRTAFRTCKVLCAALTQPKGANGGFSPCPGSVICLRFDSLSALARVTHSREARISKWRYNGCGR